MVDLGLCLLERPQGAVGGDDLLGDAGQHLLELLDFRQFGSVPIEFVLEVELGGFFGGDVLLRGPDQFQRGLDFLEHLPGILCFLCVFLDQGGSLGRWAVGFQSAGREERVASTDDFLRHLLVLLGLHRGAATELLNLDDEVLVGVAVVGERIVHALLLPGPEVGPLGRQACFAEARLGMDDIGQFGVRLGVGGFGLSFDAELGDLVLQEALEQHVGGAALLEAEAHFGFATEV